MNSPSQRILALAIASAVALPFSGKAHDGNDRDRDRDRFDYEQASAQWWQWALSIPNGVNPLADATGAHCMVGQRGPLWFLAGTFSGTATRHCSIPEGVALFFPVANSVQIDTPGVCGQTGRLTVAQMRANNAAFIDGITALSVTLDSRPVRQLRRVRSVPFASVLPADNVFLAPCSGDSPAGVYAPSVDDGYYVKLPPLAPGQHVLQFTAANPGAGFNLNVSYVLTVVRTRQAH
ncbi:hypothetical protein [Azohydromonas aeria]|uniref:hypothetical protein n=1 Tax=Azohydromonas aeria TaxID=2590212 RepID=UPI0012F7BA44|nr:hypothetical protein [Azohydromonas aeria]